MNESFTVAAIQASPVFLDAAASTVKACELIGRAAATGASLAAFSETWLPGYPRWVNAGVSVDLRRSITARYFDNAIEIGGPETTLLCEAARTHSIDVVIGIVEREPRTQGSVYATLLFIGSDGTILGRHRKLKPTGGERTAWSDGDGAGLQAYQRPYARISGLNCWEHNMVLPGYALIADGTQVHVAAWPGAEPLPPAISRTRQLLLSRAFASQSGAYVMLVGGLLIADEIEDPDVRAVMATLPDFTGDSYIIDPFGEVIAGPAIGEQLLTAEISLDQVRRAKEMCDAAGHYSRPDVLQLRVNRAVRSPLAEW
jgi:nitrilase